MRYFDASLYLTKHADKEKVNLPSFKLWLQLIIIRQLGLATMDGHRSRHLDDYDRDEKGALVKMVHI